MFLIIIAALLGVWRYRSKSYFTWVAITALWMFAAGFLFYAGGTLEDPAGDGIITRQIRVATQDGPGMALFGIIFVMTYWGAVIFFISRMVKATRTIRPTDHSVFAEDYSSVAHMGRKVGETIAILVVSVLYGWFVITQPSTQRQTSLNRDWNIAPDQEPKGLTIEQELLGAAADINAAAPKRLDEVTVLERASVSGRNFTYHYMIDTSSEDREQLERFFRTSVLPQVCTSELRSGMREHGVSYTYRYKAVSFSLPVVMRVDEYTCASLEG